MKYYVLDDYREPQKKKLNRKKVIKTILFSLLAIMFVVVVSLYIAHAEARAWMDKYIFGKEMTENTGVIITGETDLSSASIYAYDRYIVVLSRNNLQVYNASGKQTAQIGVTITNPIVASNGRYFCLAEKGGTKLYLIADGNILWQKDLENEISQVYVNQNGYISVSHKTIVKLFSSAGKEITTAYLSSTYAIATAVSNDNTELAIAEVNYSGNLVQSSLKIISVERAQKEPNSAVIYTYKAGVKEILTGIQYQPNNVLFCLFDGRIAKRVGEEVIDVTKFDDNTLFASIYMTDYSVEVKRKSAGLFNSTAEVEIKQISNGKSSLYDLPSLPKAMKTCQNVIALNLGTEAHFVATNGWLIKKYTSTRDIKDIVVSSNIAGIVYKDKIELVNL